MSETRITAALVRALAGYGDLPLPKGREAVLAPTLNGWIAMANELNRKMSQQEHWTLIPMAVFTHPPR